MIRKLAFIALCVYGGSAMAGAPVHGRVLEQPAVSGPSLASAQFISGTFEGKQNRKLPSEGRIIDFTGPFSTDVVHMKRLDDDVVEFNVRSELAPDGNVRRILGLTINILKSEGMAPAVQSIHASMIARRGSTLISTETMTDVMSDIVFDESNNTFSGTLSGRGTKTSIDNATFSFSLAEQ
ncbi:hypothetical protein [Dyella sp.]|uniref:hypothetical protein n=1 Tax=Dyella sp. TaxID=1869338 RepID=UPI002ED6A4B6